MERLGSHIVSDNFIKVTFRKYPDQFPTELFVSSEIILNGQLVTLAGTGSGQSVVDCI